MGNKMKKDDLGNRMKTYEHAYRFYLPNRLPIIIRIDGRAFHTFTNKFNRPFDDMFQEGMRITAKKLCEEVSGCKLAYVQSDEISLLITNNDNINTQPWFDNNMQKLISLTASIATSAFDNFCKTWYTEEFLSTHTPTFDSRVFVLPPDEVVNYFIWRQQDAIRNSIQMVAQSLYSHKTLQNKNSNELQEMIKAKDVDWNKYPTTCKRGSCVVRKEHEVDGVIRHKWEIDKEIPVFSKNRDYIDQLFIH